MLKLLGYHTNLNSLTSWGQTKVFSYLMLDMCYGGTLEDVVNRTNTGFTENQAAACMTILLQATKYIHGKGWFSVSSKQLATLQQSRCANTAMALQGCYTTISSQRTFSWQERMM